jgi:hypothetical protein
MDAINTWLPTSKGKPVVNMIEIDRCDPTAMNVAQLPQDVNEFPVRNRPMMDIPHQVGYSHQHLSQQFPQLSQLSQASLSQAEISHQVMISQQAALTQRMNQQAAFTQQMHLFGNTSSYGNLLPDDTNPYASMGHRLP